MLAAPLALAIRPGMAWKPGVFNGGHAALLASQRPIKGEDLEQHSFGIGKLELILTLVGKTIPIVGNAIQAQRTEPVTTAIPGGSPSAVLQGRFRNFHCPGRAHTPLYRNHLVRVKRPPGVARAKFFGILLRNLA